MHIQITRIDSSEHVATEDYPLFFESVDRDRLPGRWRAVLAAHRKWTMARIRYNPNSFRNPRLQEQNRAI